MLLSSLSNDAREISLALVDKANDGRGAALEPIKLSWEQYVIRNIASAEAMGRSMNGPTKRPLSTGVRLRRLRKERTASCIVFSSTRALLTFLRSGDGRGQDMPVHHHGTYRAARSILQLLYAKINRGNKKTNTGHRCPDTYTKWTTTYRSTTTRGGNSPKNITINIFFLNM